MRAIVQQPCEQITLLRMRAGMTQADLARRAGVSKSVVWGAENGRVPKIAAQTKIAEALELGRFDLWPLIVEPAKVVA